MTTPAESFPPGTDPAWLSTWRPDEGPAAAVDLDAARAEASREGNRIVRQHALLGGPLVVAGALILSVDAPAWSRRLAVVLLVLGLVVSTAVSMLRARRVTRRLADRARQAERLRP